MRHISRFQFSLGLGFRIELRLCCTFVGVCRSPVRVRRSPVGVRRSPSESDRTSPIRLQKSPIGLILMKYSIFDQSDGVRSDFFICINGNLRFHRSPIGSGRTWIGLIEVRPGLRIKALSPRIVKISPRIVSDVRRTSDRVRSDVRRPPESGRTRSDSDGPMLSRNTFPILNFRCSPFYWGFSTSSFSSFTLLQCFKFG